MREALIWTACKGQLEADSLLDPLSLGDKVSVVSAGRVGLHQSERSLLVSPPRPLEGVLGEVGNVLVGGLDVGVDSDGRHGGQRGRRSELA